MTSVLTSWWRFVFWWKKRTGFLDLGQTIEVTGTVVGEELPDVDRDQNFDVRLDPGFERYITGFGGRLTSGAPGVGPSIHCEIPPWASAELRAAYRTLRIGDRVRVVGGWGFDGVHTGRAEWIEVVLAIVRHQPNVAGGWFEIHPVTELEVLGPGSHHRTRDRPDRSSAG